MALWIIRCISELGKLGSKFEPKSPVSFPLVGMINSLGKTRTENSHLFPASWYDTFLRSNLENYQNPKLSVAEGNVRNESNFKSDGEFPNSQINKQRVIMISMFAMDSLKMRGKSIHRRDCCANALRALEFTFESLSRTGN
ncbi:hypothetical protein CEXT_750351 [Caerostris extrusa]|uniref:Uncharacterized protein n=1 Tax=Caerostris extrusa TaxID=172846 RepID=A0AAV4XN27_CAEEX|nr:hypothetical protein CEXT_750351 [Caerostris extrusa]